MRAALAFAANLIARGREPRGSMPMRQQSAVASCVGPARAPRSFMRMRSTWKPTSLLSAPNKAREQLRGAPVKQIAQTQWWTGALLCRDVSRPLHDALNKFSAGRDSWERAVAHSSRRPRH